MAGSKVEQFKFLQMCPQGVDMRKIGGLFAFHGRHQHLQGAILHLGRGHVVALNRAQDVIEDEAPDFVEDADDGPRPRIIDFGVAKAVDPAAQHSAALTQQRQLVGTPTYMAPEQIRGEPTTPATEIYAFGATAFHLVTGRPPFVTGDVINAHLDTMPPNPLDLTPDLDPDLAEIILRCLEKDPSRRFIDAEQLRSSLQRIRS